MIKYHKEYNRLTSLWVIYSTTKDQSVAKKLAVRRTKKAADNYINKLRGKK